MPNIKELAKAYGAHNDELHLPMDTQIAFNPLSADVFRTKLRDAETALNGNLPLFFFENHDNPRSLTRYARQDHEAAVARLLATLLLTPRASALVYYGEEIGMVNNDPKRKEDVRDPIGKIGWPREIGRDGERTPMQWDGAVNAGFSSGKTTWLPVGPNYTTRNVAAESKDPGSLLNYYKALIHLRKTNAALRDGDFALVNETDKDVLAFTRRSKDGILVLVALNFSAAPRTTTFQVGSQATTLVSSFAKDGETVNLKNLSIPAYGAFVGRVQ